MLKNWETYNSVLGKIRKYFRKTENSKKTGKKVLKYGKFVSTS